MMAGRKQVMADGGVAAFLARAAQHPPLPVAATRGRLVLAMDATMSRQPMWDRALALQAEMFSEAVRVSGLDVQLVYFRGFDECRASKWTSDAQGLARLMTGVECRGGNTQIGRVLRHIKAACGAGKINAAVYVGDAVEEDIDGLCRLAGEVGLLGVPLFMFQDGRDPGARKAFKEMARLSRGAYHALDGHSTSVLRQLLGAVAAYASGGREALQRLGAAGNDASRTLLAQLG
jgi:hypothetical protein